MLPEAPSAAHGLRWQRLILLTDVKRAEAVGGRMDMTKEGSPLRAVARGFVAEGEDDQAALTLLCIAWNAMDQGYHHTAARELLNAGEAAKAAAKRLDNDAATLAHGLAAWTWAALPTEQLRLARAQGDLLIGGIRGRLEEARSFLERARSPWAIRAQNAADAAKLPGYRPRRPKPALSTLPNFASTPSRR